jgi:hypothetical protein
LLEGESFSSQSSSISVTMSLRGFHIVFVTVSSLLCLFIAVWAFALAPEPSAMATSLGVVGVLGLVVMPVYGVYFYRKAAKLVL